MHNRLTMREAVIESRVEGTTNVFNLSKFRYFRPVNAKVNTSTDGARQRRLMVDQKDRLYEILKQPIQP